MKQGRASFLELKKKFERRQVRDVIQLCMFLCLLWLDEAKACAVLNCNKQPADQREASCMHAEKQIKRPLLEHVLTLILWQQHAMEARQRCWQPDEQARQSTCDVVTDVQIETQR